MAGAVTAFEGKDPPGDPGPRSTDRVSAQGGPPAAGARRPIGTQGRLVTAFALLGAAVAAAFGVQLVGLSRMQGGMAELRDHQEQMYLALALEQAVREEYAQTIQALSRGQSAADGVTEQAVSELVRRLVAAVDEPEAAQWVGRMAAAVRQLEERCRADLAAVAAVRPMDPGAEQERFALVFEVEENADRLVEFLRDRSASQSTAVEGLRRRSLALAVAFALVLPLFALAAGLYLSRGIARPLALVGEVAARISRGDLRARIVPRGPSELTALGVELNAMAAALEHHQERLLRSEKLAGLGRLAAGVAHEINNPLQVMLGYLALHRGKVPGELGADLARVEREASRCREIVEGLLQLSRPAVMAPPEPVDLRQLADEVAEAIRVTTPGVRLRVRGAGRALGSAPRLRQVILNLVKNAAEAAGPSGVVEIEVGGEGATASVVVTDSGPGIPPSVRGRVFEPFFTTKPGGTGLGLALARAIAQAHGGDVELEDTPAGARFCLRAQRCGEGGWT